MTQSFTYDGDPLLRVRHSTVLINESAELGAVGSSRLTVNDVTGTLAIVGQKDIAIDQDDCSNPVLARGFVDDQEYERGPNSQGPSREIGIAWVDLNAMLGFVTFSGDSEDEGDRPAETVDERLAWLTTWLGTNLPGLFVGTRIGSSDRGLDETNFRDQNPTDVLAGIVVAAGGWQYYVRDFGTGDGPELVCRDDNTSTDDTTSIVISNRAGDADYSTIFPPFKDFKLSKRPGRVGSRMRFSYSEDVVTEERAATADAFNGRRDLTASDSSVTEEATARERAKELLWQHHTEERVIEGTLLLPPEAVNLVSQGDRIGVRLEHLTPEGFYDADELVYCRILERTVKPLLKPTRLYEVRVKLSPQEERPPVGKIIQSCFDFGGAQGAYPRFANPVTIGSKLVFMVVDRDGNGNEPNRTTVSEPTWGSGAWTEISLQDIDASGDPDTIRAFWKVADSTNQECWIDASFINVACWELPSTADPASMTVHDVELQTGATFTIGTIGDTDSGDVMLMGVGWYEEPRTEPGITYPTSWTQRWKRPSYWTWYSHHPWSWFGDATGAHTGLVASISRGAAKKYAGIALRIPAA